MKNIEINTQRELILTVSKRWDEWYSVRYGSDKHKMEIGRKLRQLDLQTVKAQKVNDIIGNDTWTTVSECSCCGKQGTSIMRIGEEPDYESATAYICKACLKQAVLLYEEFDKAEGK